MNKEELTRRYDIAANLALHWEQMLTESEAKNVRLENEIARLVEELRVARGLPPCPEACCNDIKLQDLFTTPRYVQEIDEKLVKQTKWNCKACNKWFISNSDDPFQIKSGPNDWDWLSYVQCVCGNLKMLSSGGYRKNRRVLESLPGKDKL